MPGAGGKKKGEPPGGAPSIIDAPGGGTGARTGNRLTLIAGTPEGGATGTGAAFTGCGTGTGGLGGIIVGGCAGLGACIEGSVDLGPIPGLSSFPRSPFVR